MSSTPENKQQHSERRENLISNNIEISNIEGLYHCEQRSLVEAIAKHEEEESSNDVFFDASTFCNVHAYINCPINLTFLYLANVFSMEEWSFGVRNIQRLPRELFCGEELSANKTKYYLHWEVYEDNRSIEHSAAWDQGGSLWMKSYFRLLDAMPNLGRSGSLLLRVTSYHSYFDKNASYLPLHVQKTQRRKNRDWIGDRWEQNCKKQLLEVHNLKTILEARFKDTQS